MRVLTVFRQRPILLFAIAVLVAISLVALFAPVIAPGSMDEQDLARRLKPPGWRDTAGRLFVAGTDHLGRDIATRLVYGSRISLLVGAMAVVVGGSAGLLLGLISGFFGGTLDAIIMRFADMQLAFPFLLLALALVSILGPGLFNVILVLALTSWISYAKVIRGDVLLLRNREYIQAARALGMSNIRILFRHVLPNVLSSFLVVASFQVAALIIAESSLSYLGLGVPTLIPTWGGMLADGREYVTDAWWLSVLPGAAIMLSALSFNLLGDGIRDLMDPTQRSSGRRRKRPSEQRQDAQPGKESPQDAPSGKEVNQRMLQRR